MVERKLDGGHPGGLVGYRIVYSRETFRIFRDAADKKYLQLIPIEITEKLDSVTWENRPVFSTVMGSTTRIEMKGEKIQRMFFTFIS